MPIREKNGKWHYRFHINGRPFYGPTGLDATPRNVTAAMRKEAEARRLVLEGKERLLKLEIRPFNEAAEQFLTWADGEYPKESTSKRIRGSFNSLTAYFKKTPLTAITVGMIDDFKSHRRSEHEVRDVTIRHDLHALSLFFQYAIRHNWLRDNLVTADVVPSDRDAVRMHVLTRTEEAMYLGAGEVKLAKDARYQSILDLARLMLNQGCRPEELLSMRCQHVSLDRGTFLIEAGKSDAARRTLRMTPESRAIFARRLSSGSPWVFEGKRAGSHATKLNNAHERILAALKKAGTPLEFVIYDFRHTFATRLVTEAGVDLATAAQILGHKGLRSIQKYVHPQQVTMDGAMDKFAKLFGQETSTAKERVQ